MSGTCGHTKYKGCEPCGCPQDITIPAEKAEEMREIANDARIYVTRMNAGNLYLINRIESLITALTPPMEEPTRFGAVVVDEDGRKWVRHWGRNVTFPWMEEGCNEPYRFSDIKSPRLLQEGVE